MLIQLLLLVCAGALLWLFIRHWDKVRTRAWKRIAFLVFIAANVYAVLRPQDTTWVANHVGVGRGTDLVLYLLVAGVAFMALNTYLRFRAVERKITDLARSIALREARSLNAARGAGRAVDPAADPAADRAADRAAERPEASPLQGGGA